MFAITVTALQLQRESSETRLRSHLIFCSHLALMQNSLNELKDKLVQALDHHNNVVDMAQVIEVISILERTIITKDDLEKTRLGKYINELRKKTLNEALARRAKKLVKSWRKLMERSADSAASPLNGQRISPTGPGPGQISPGLRLLSARSQLMPTSLLPQNGKSSVSPASMSTTSSSRLIASPTDYCSASNSPMLPPSHSSSYAPLSSRAYNKPVSPVGAHSTYDVSKTNAANKRPRKDIKFNFNGIFELQAHELKRSEGSVASLSPVVSPVVYDNNNCTVGNAGEDNIIVRQRGRKRKVKQENDPLKDKFNHALRINKLQTTQELAQKFNIEIQSHENQDQTLNERIASSFSAKSFPKNASDVDDETKTKSELMHRFLSSTTSPTNREEEEEQEEKNNYHSFDTIRDNNNSDYTMPAISHSVHLSEHPLPSTSSSHNVVSRDSIGDEINDILSQLPPININDIVWSDSQINDNFDKDSNHIQNNIDSSNDNNNDNSDQISSELDNDNEEKDRPNKVEVSEAHVEKLLEEKWEYVNGTYDSETEWREWHQMTSGVSYNGDILHILPYVNIN